MSFTYIINNISPLWAFTVNKNPLLSNHFRNVPWIPKDLIFISKCWWHTMSNAFGKSKYITSVPTPSSSVAAISWRTCSTYMPFQKAWLRFMNKIINIVTYHTYICFKELSLLHDFSCTDLVAKTARPGYISVKQVG